MTFQLETLHPLLAMPVFDLFSKRRKRELGQTPDVYQYHSVPPPLRVSIAHILNDTLGGSCGYSGNDLFSEIKKILLREYGLIQLGSKSETDRDALLNFLIQEKDDYKVLDVIELAFRIIHCVVRYPEKVGYLPDITADDAISELNARFREYGVGFQFEEGFLIKISSQVIHAEVVKPVLSFLSAPEFKGPNEEFLSAHQHYRAGKHKECLNDCLKAFESTMKVICDLQGWGYDKKDTAKTLVETLYQKKLIPEFMQNHISGLRSALEGGVPTLRNKLGGHGQGAEPIEVPDSVAAFALHLTASNILFLVKAQKELK